MVIIVFFLPLVFWGLTVAVADMLYGIVTAPATGEGGLLSVVTDNTFPIFAVQQAMEGLADTLREQYSALWAHSCTSVHAKSKSSQLLAGRAQMTPSASEREKPSGISSSGVAI